MIILLSGLLYSLIFPKFNFYYLFSVSFVPLILSVLYCSQNKSGLKKIFYLSWASGTLAHLVLLYWIYPTLLRNYAGYFASLLGLVSLSLYLGLYWGLFGTAVFLIQKLDIKHKIIMISCVWTLLEYVKTYLLSGFPWLLSGYSVWKFPELIQITAVTGIFGLSFLVIYINTSIAFSIKTRRIRPALTALIAVSLIYIYGLITLNKYDEAGNLKISILQGNISQYRKWDSEYHQDIMDTYRRLHDEVLKNKPDLIIWPETAVPDALTSNIGVASFMQELSEKSDAYQLVGSIEKKRGKYYNSAYLVFPDGRISEPYRKLHLTPFGEYIPLRAVFSPFIKVLNEIGDFDSGSRYRLLETDNYKIGVGICFEEIFPGLVRKFFREGADIFVNITNDGWFLNTAGPYQHFVHSIFRAVENRTYVLRAANTGISAIISPAGRIIEETPLLKTTVLSGRAAKSSGQTFYTAYGDIIIILCFLFVNLIMWRDRRCLKNIKNCLKN